MRSTRMIIDCRKLKNNIAELKKRSANSAMLAIVKANAYGHGALAIAKYALEYGVEWLGVATPEEGAYLRENGIEAPILVLGAANGEELEICVKYSLHQTVFDEARLVELNDIAKKIGKKAYAHIKINSGMNRIGISDENEWCSLLKKIKECDHVDANGVFTHFATADDEDTEFFHNQEKKFIDMLAIARNSGVTFKYIHACNTAAAMRGSADYCNLIRVGIGLYGYYPSSYLKSNYNCSIEPIAKFVTNISAVNTVKKGDAVSYGASFVADKEMRIATLPVGYADGYNRLHSNKGRVIINGKYVNIIGRVCMDQMMVDISQIPDADVGTEVILMGKCGNLVLDADELANACMTISYEVLTSIAQRVERVYIE